MTVAAPTRSTHVAPRDDLFRLSVEQYHEMIRSGILTTDDRVELLEGVLFSKMSIYPPHSGTVRLVREVLLPLLPPGTRYRSEQPITLSDGEPEPDGVIARGTPADDFVFHPGGDDVLLVIEVSDASLVRDQTIKARSYARAAIPFYWIIDLVERRIEVHTDPDRVALPWPIYRSRTVYAAGTSISLDIDSRHIADVAGDALLPPR